MTRDALNAVDAAAPIAARENSLLVVNRFIGISTPQFITQIADKGNPI
jgi:hypothetical protein